MKRYKRWSCLWLVAVSSALLAVGVFNFIVDPFQYFRKASFYKPFFKDARFLNPGVAKNYPYDTVILGTSMAQNFRPSYIREKLGFEAVKLAIPGGSAYEERLALDVALRTGKVKKVIFALNVPSFAGEPERFSNGEAGMPLYLYDDNLLNDVNYLFSLDAILYYKYLVRANVLKKQLDKTDIDNYGTWAKIKDSRFSEAKVLEDWERGEFNKSMSSVDYEVNKLVKSFEVNLLNVVKKYKDIEFIVFYPPYSALVWADFYRTEKLESILLFKKQVFSLTRSIKNLKLYDFQDHEDITYNLDNYKDISHYAPEINDFIVDSLAKGDFLVKEEAIDAQMLKLRNTGMLFSRKY